MKRWMAWVLTALLILGGCAPKEEELISQNNNLPMAEQSAAETEQTESAEPTESDPVDTTAPQSSAQTQTPAQSTGKESATQTPAQNDAPAADTPVSKDEPAQPTQTKDKTLVDITTDVRYFGRTYYQNSTYWFNWTASGFEFTFNGTGAEATLETESRGEEHTAFIKIYIDGKEQTKSIAITDSMQTVTLCKGLKSGVHTVRVVKRTNGRSASLGLMDITLLKGGTIEAPPAAKERRIEFVGDSITVGYGVLATSATAVWSTKTEDGTQTYAALAGNALHAEYNVVAISGRGLAHNTGGDTDKLMPALYTGTDGYNNAGAAWDFNSFQPHVVVVNLGTNDHSTSTESEVTAAATAFLKTIRKNNPSAYIIVAYGMMGNKMEGALKSAVSACGDNKISYLALKIAENRLLGHPDKTSHQENALLLEKEIRRLTGWKD